jgi:hypothetical protein
VPKSMLLRAALRRAAPALLLALGLAGCCFDPVFGPGGVGGTCNPFTVVDHCEGSAMIGCSAGHGVAYVERTECEGGCFEAPDGPLCSHWPTSACTPGEPDRCGAAIDVGVLLEHCRPITAGGGMWESGGECFRGCNAGHCIE